MQKCKNYSYVRAYIIAQLSYTTQHTAILIISPLYPPDKQQSSDAVYCMAGGHRPLSNQSTCVCTGTLVTCIAMLRFFTSHGRHFALKFDVEKSTLVDSPTSNFTPIGAWMVCGAPKLKNIYNFRIHMPHRLGDLYKKIFKVCRQLPAGLHTKFGCIHSIFDLHGWG